MKLDILEIEAESLESARQQAQERVPAGSSLLSEEILCDGEEKTATAVADSASAALELARAQVPEGAAVVSEKELQPASRRSIELEAFDEQAARLSVQRTLDRTALIEGVLPKTQGKKGLLGMGKKPSLYQVTVFQRSVAEVRFKPRARIRVKIGQIPSTGFCQWCGRPDSPAERHQTGVNFFCSAACRTNYFTAARNVILYGPSDLNRLMMGASGQSSEQMMASSAAATATSHCWSCGALVRMTEKRCTSCGEDREIKL